MSTAGPLIVVGDALLDCDMDGQVSRLCPDAPAPVLEDAVPAWRPGGAALAALLAATEEIPVILVAPLGDDEASATVRALLKPHVTVVGLPLTGPLTEKARFRAGDRTLLRADRAGGSAGAAGAEAAEAITAAGTVLVSDYGGGVSADQRIRAALTSQAKGVPLVWDPHPKGTRPVPHARLVTPNYAEAVAATGQSAVPGAQLLRSAAAAAQQLSRAWHADAVAVTLGGRGSVLVQGGIGPLVVPAERLAVTDTCGAGDRFAAAAAAVLRQGALTSEAVTAATAAASSYLAAGGAALYGSPTRSAAVALPPRAGTGKAAGAGRALRRDQDAAELARQVRAAGGTVVATGGCFDLLHAGHVSLLQAARSLGDCLIVCLNSDASVRALKGDGRPLNHAADRAAVLAALGCVDAITVFSEDTPCAALDRIRPDIWVKGGDYDGRDLPEAALLENWGAVAVTVPYLSGRSTTRLHAAQVDGADLSLGINHLAMPPAVLLLRALGLGDFLTGVPAYRAVRRAFPAHRLVLAAPGGLAPLVPLTQAVDELLPSGELEPIRWTGPAPDIAIDLHGRGPASHLLVAALHPRRLIVFGGEHAGGFTGPAWRPGEHEVARWCRLCQESGIPADPGDLLLAPPQPVSPAFTLLHPGAAAPARRWPASSFAAVGRRLAAGGHVVQVTGSTAERALASRVAHLAGLPGEHVLAGRTSLAGLAALAASARLVISGDTGMAHLASAYARPSVTLFGPVPPSEWGPPRHPRHQALWRGASGYRGDPHGPRIDPALRAITVDAVCQAAAIALHTASATPADGLTGLTQGTAGPPRPSPQSIRRGF